MSEHSLNQKPDITVILTAHKEGVLAGVTAQNMMQAIEYAAVEKGLRSEIIVVLDNASETTTSVLHQYLDKVKQDTPIRFLETQEGDPGQARNRGIALAQGVYSTFLDGDDLWSKNWLTKAWELCSERPDVVAQSMANVVFGCERNLWWHIDSESELFDPDYLHWANYWDAMSFARTDIYRSIPFKKNDLKLGFGHEDWHWSVLTHARGIPHKPVQGTIHFKRRRMGSQMNLVEQAGGVVWPI